MHALECGFALTFHKVQGKTLPKVVLELAERPFKTGKGHLDFNGWLVALSRVASTADLRILAAPDDQFEYLRHFCAPQSLLLWLEGFADGKGVWNIDRCRTAVEQAIIDGIFVDAVRGKKVNQPYLAKLIRQAAELAKSVKKKGTTKSVPKKKPATATTSSSRVRSMKPAKPMPPAVYKAFVAKMVARKQTRPVVNDKKVEEQLDANAPAPPVLPPVKAATRAFKRKGMCDSVTEGTSSSLRSTSGPFSVVVGRTGPVVPLPVVSVPRPPPRPLAPPFPGYSLTQAQRDNALFFISQCVYRTTPAAWALNFRSTDKILPSVFTKIFHPDLLGNGTLGVDNNDVATLSGTKWLDGGTISTILHLQVLQRALQPGVDRAHRVTIFDSYFFRNLKDGTKDLDFKAARMVSWMSGRTVKKQLTPDEAFSGDILFPLHHGENHWLLVIIPKLLIAPGKFASGPRVVYVLDPYGYGVKHVSHFCLIAAWLQRAYPDDVRPVTPIYEVRDIPQQGDMFSCGVYVSMFAYHWIWCGTLLTKGDFADAKAAAFRLFMAHTISEASQGGLERAMKEYIHQGTGLPEDLYTPRAGNVVRPPVLPRHLHVVLCTKVEAWMSTGVPGSVITVED